MRASIPRNRTTALPGRARSVQHWQPAPSSPSHAVCVCHAARWDAGESRLSGISLRSAASDPGCRASGGANRRRDVHGWVPHRTAALPGTSSPGTRLLNDRGATKSSAPTQSPPNTFQPPLSYTLPLRFAPPARMHLGDTDGIQEGVGEPAAPPRDLKLAPGDRFPHGWKLGSAAVSNLSNRLHKPALSFQSSDRASVRNENEK